jgi:hypothetical protein
MVGSQDAAIGMHINITMNAHAKVKITRKAKVATNQLPYSFICQPKRVVWLTDHTL